MNNLSLFFSQHLAEIYLVYGLTFFVLGLVLLLLPKQSGVLKFSGDLWLVSVFGIALGIQEWLEWWSGTYGHAAWLDWLSAALLMLSFASLLEFGRRLLLSIPGLLVRSDMRRLFGPVLTLLLLMFAGVFALLADDILLGLNLGLRYWVSFPGALLAGVGFLEYRRYAHRELNQLNIHGLLGAAGLGFVLYGIFAGLVAKPEMHVLGFLPGYEEVFGKTVLPIQLIRAVCGVVITVALYQILRALGNHTLQQLNVLNETLEQRVDERTRELSSANRSLEQEINERLLVEKQLQFLANHDPLTKLPNRSFFCKRLGQAIDAARRKHSCLGVLFIDLDRFKYVNDTLGHAAGDLLLTEAAHRLARCLRKSDTLARLGGDEFVILDEEVEDKRNLANLAQRIIDELKRPFKLLDHEVTISASIGISVYPENGTTQESLRKHSDVAMYRAKALGKSTYQFYSPDQDQHSIEQLALENDLHQALQRDELFLQYQPKIDLRSGRLAGLEALVRWRPGGGKELVPPEVFIRIAEDSGLILPISNWVIDQVCAQLGAWHRRGLPVPRVAINLSARQFRHDELKNFILDSVSLHKIEPHWLELEITESALMEDAQAAAEILSELKALGMTIAIDDFGTGYSSLSYLKKFDLDSLKIDCSFVREITSNPDDAAIAVTIINMAKSLGLSVVAECIESQAQHDFLASTGCDMGQGFLYNPPLLGSQVERHYLLAAATTQE
ncbi:MAG TPA: EAL domain-containing protein [Gallionellaceae bacterium]|nr:EAL domain-containing protein [Gallionellaceae bacterium]